ncbi:hypothetical protein OUZ56_032263 [Daphnia magna]|uniref:DUF4806 domain-containing protein n=1 Tax=Daphnia magna TaxID=35525 RepID=A0ABQ9ZWM6_9CRUS|nr:hypothetical protein OUZ56_032263 [Daphnia magna]
MDVVTECRPISYDKATYEIRKISNCLAATTEADHNSFESWEIPPQPLADSSSCSDLAVLEQTVASTRNSTIHPFPSQESTPKKKMPPFQRQKPVSHSDGQLGSSSHSSLTAVDGEFSGSLNGAANISKSEDGSLHGDTGSIVGDNGSTIRVTGSAKRGARASNRGSVTQNHRAGSLYGVVPQNDSGFLNGSRNNSGSSDRVAVSKSRKAATLNVGIVSRYGEAGSNGSSDRDPLSVNRATGSTCGTTLAIDDDDWKKKMLESMTVTNSILRFLVPSSVYVGNNLTKNIAYFRKTVEKNLDLPLKLVENVSALNNALIDIDLSVSLSAVLIEDLGHVTYESTLAKSIMDFIFTRELCCKVQWKGRSGRGRDTRPAIGHLTNMLAIFGVVMTNVLEQHKKPIQISKVLECVQAARRVHQFNYHKSVNVPDMAGNGDEEDNGEKLEKNERTKSIVEALENYREL